MELALKVLETLGVTFGVIAGVLLMKGLISLSIMIGLISFLIFFVYNIAKVDYNKNYKEK